jgi:hypothetical protein
VERLVPRKYKHLANALKLTDDSPRVGHEYFRIFPTAVGRASERTVQRNS